MLTYRVFAQRFDAYGNMVSTEFRVNTHTKDNQNMPDIVGLDDGGFLITWHSYLQEDLVTNSLKKGYGVFGQRYNADNLPVGNEFQVNTYTDNNQANPNVISLTDGSVVMSWESTGQNGATDIDIYAQHFETGIAKTTTDKPALTVVKDTTIKVPSIISFEGTSQDDSLQGDEGNNTILGLAGNDILNGGDGDDIIKGGAGKDVLNGGVGVDILIGGAGADVFKFTNIKELGSTEETADVVVDFNIKQKDKIDLSGIDANEDIAGDQVFKLVNLFSEDDATGQLVFDVKTQMIYGSTNADVSPELAIQVSGITSFTATDFIL